MNQFSLDRLPAEFIQFRMKLLTTCRKGWDGILIVMLIFLFFYILWPSYFIRKQHSQKLVITQFYTENYLNGVLTLAYSIWKWHPEVDIAILYIEDQVKPSSVALLERIGCKLHRVGRILPVAEPIFDRFKDQYTKFEIWNFIEYDRIVYIDADCLVVGDISALLDLPSSIPFAAIGDAWENEFKDHFNAGVMSLKPSKDTFHALIEHMNKTDQFDVEQAEQGVLNLYFQHQLVKLSYVYNLNIAIGKSTLRPFWDTLWPNVRIVHYTIEKPFIEFGELRNPVWETPFQLWDEYHKDAMIFFSSVF